MKHWIVKFLYINLNKIHGYIERNNGTKYLTLIPIDENKGEIEKHKEASNKIKCHCESENNDSGKYHNKCMKIKFNLDYNFP